MCKRAESLRFLHKTSALLQLKFYQSVSAGELTSAGVPVLPLSWLLPAVLWPSSAPVTVQGASFSEEKLDLDVYEGGRSAVSCLLVFYISHKALSRTSPRFIGKCFSARLSSQRYLEYEG